MDAAILDGSRSRNRWKGCRDFPYSRIFSSRWSSSLCPDRIFDRAAFRSNQAARSTSGKAALRPLDGGHSISKELLTSDIVSKSASPQKAITRLPPRWRISPKARNGPIEAAGPSSSANSRRAACSGSSDVSISPFGIDQAPSSFLPVRAAGVDQQDFEAALSLAIRQNAGARLRPLGNSPGQEMVFHPVNRQDRLLNPRSSAERNDNPIPNRRRPRSALPGLVEIDQGDADIRPFLSSQMGRSVSQDDLERGPDRTREKMTATRGAVG
jgi:hypothetical protein